MKTSDKFTPHAIRKAQVATGLFSVWFVAVGVLSVINWSVAWPLVLFYVLMLINTFFSIRVFSSITPRNNTVQICIDFLLAGCIMLLPFTFNSPIGFGYICLFLFIIATLKYIFLVTVVGFSKLLYKKIKTDTLGILLCGLFLVGVLYNFSYISSIIFLGIFAIANVYVLWHKPLYKIEHHIEEFFNK